MKRLILLSLGLAGAAACFDFGGPLPEGIGGDARVAGADASGGSSSTARVVMRGLKFNPSEVTIKAGGSVTFVMEDTGTFHEVFEGRPRGGGDPVFKTMKLNAGEETTVTFDQPGEWGFYCTNHSTTMRNGRVIVEPN